MTQKLNRHGGMTPAWALLHWAFSFSCPEFGDLHTNMGAASPWPLVMGLISIIHIKANTVLVHGEVSPRGDSTNNHF